MTWETYAVTPGMMEEERRFLRAPTKRVSCDIHGYPVYPAAYGGEPIAPTADRPSDTEAPVQDAPAETEFQYILRKWREFAKAEGREMP